MTTSPTMRERLIEAVANELWELDAGPRQWCDKVAVGIVNTVLEVLRTPDEGMIRAGATWDRWCEGEGGNPQPDVFTAMIDQIRGSS